MSTVHEYGRERPVHEFVSWYDRRIVQCDYIKSSNSSQVQNMGQRIEPWSLEGSNGNDKQIERIHATFLQRRFPYAVTRCNVRWMLHILTAADPVVVRFDPGKAMGGELRRCRDGDDRERPVQLRPEHPTIDVEPRPTTIDKTNLARFYPSNQEREPHAGAETALYPAEVPDRLGHVARRSWDSVRTQFVR